MYDVIVIGAGVSGSATARELSRYDLKVGVLEKEEDVCCGTSKANSGIVHAGFDARPGSLMAKMNVRGNQMMEQLTEDLDIPFERNGSLVLCFAKDEMESLEKLKKQGEENGVKRLQILSGEEVRRMESDLSKEVYAALYAPTGGIVCPFELNLALAENACQNGAEFYFDTAVEQIEKTEGGYRIHAGEKTYETRCVVNAAGVYADVFHNMVSEKKIRITPRKGEYYLLDKKAGTTVHHTIFQIPGAYGKGVLVTPTTHGNLLVGPTAVDIEEKEGTNTTKTGLDEVAQKARGTIVGLTRGVNKYHIIRATLESIAYQAHDVIKAMEADAGIRLNGLKVDGGASANDFLMQTQADMIQAPVKRPSCVETTAMGAAYLAGLAVGYWRDQEEVRANWSIDRTFEPEITVEEQEKRMKGWKKAVRYSFNWAKED